MKRYLLLQLIILVLGTLFAFYTVYTDFTNFYAYEGTLLKIKDCVVPNPVTTPCFYGAFAFLASLIWSTWIYLAKDVQAKFNNQKKLLFLLGFGVVFAWSNFSYELYKFLTLEAGAYVGCSSSKGLAHTPFTTPCFYGAVLFLLSFLAGLLAFKKLRELATFVRDR